MPLKAICDGKEVIGELMGYQEWKDLKKKVQDGSVKLTTACCGVECYARDRQGTRHFVHKHVGNCSTGKGETMEHLLLKARILRGCRDAGYDVDTEVADSGGWRADVLAKKGKIKVAFEVQWSPQTYEETAVRQKKYEDSHVRGVWLFRKMPDQTESITDVNLQRDIPMFQIDWETRKWDKFKWPQIYGFDPETFARELLLWHLIPRNRIRLEPVQIIRLDIAETSCHRCHQNYHIVHFNDSKSPLVDVHGKKHHGWNDLFPNGVEYSPVVVDALDAYKRTAWGNKYKIGEIKPRYSHTEKKSYMSQGCPHCDALNGRFYLEMEWHHLKVVGYLHLAVPIPEGSTVKGKHWCHSENNDFCPDE